MDGTTNCYDIYNLVYSLHTSFESTAYCVDDWVATMDSWIQPSIIDNWQLLGALFTFSMTHSAYGYYPLCIHSASGTNKAPSTKPDSYWGGQGSAVQNTYEAQETSCKSAQMSLIYAHCKRGDYQFWGDCVQSSVNHQGMKADGSAYGLCKPCCDYGYESALGSSSAFCDGDGGDGMTSSHAYDCW